MKYLVVAIFVMCISASLADAPIPIRIDVSTTYQTIDHFGASDCWSFQKIGAWDIENKERVADLLFSPEKGIGVSAWRFNIGGGINRQTISHPWRTVETFEVAEGVYDWSRQAEERWFLHAAKERGVKQFIAFVNSPPGRMTRNGYTNCTEGLGSTNLKPGYEDQFVRYVVDILKFFRDQEGITFNYISPVNEPQWEWNNSNQEGNRAGNDDIIAIVKALHAELQRQKVDTEISIVESGDIKSWHQLNSGMTAKYGVKYGNYLQELIDNPAISDKISTHFAGHSYWSDRLDGQMVEHRLTARPFFSDYFAQGWTYWMTEYCILDGPEGAGGNGRDVTIKSALDVARIIHYDLTHLDASAWSWWTAVSPENYKDGLIYTNYKSNPASQSIIESKILWAYGNFSRYIRPGSVRIKLTGANNKYGLLGSAYVNETGDRLFLIFVNVAEKDIPVTLQLSGLAPEYVVRTLTPYITSNKNDENLKPYPPINPADTYTVPARSVMTLVGDIQNNTQINSGQAIQPRTVRWVKNYPNPFNNKTRIDFALDKPADIELSIYNNMGQKVKTLSSGSQMAGSCSVDWDATDAFGRVISSGVYFCVLASTEGEKTIKLLVLQ
ncbi:T9SS C-terminal target domain-containing protein [candidate division KSB1 bacterium]|nr:T9SS type A sorting domain-containing protein [candidate division KSB1 bacterium]RQW00128.1 MAG: T9SS C-terminal target domain-containing protein [candidate division KSB1 bacterium]